MRVPNLYPMVCAAVLCGAIVTVCAADNPDQAAARAALEQKMNQLNAQPESTKAQTPATTAPKAQPPASKPVPWAATTSGTVRQPTHATMAHGRPAPTSNGGLFGPVPPPSGGYSARATSGGTAQPSGTNVTALPSEMYIESSSNAGAAYAGQKMGFKPIQAPPLPITAKQKAQLQALLQKYDANAVTPEQYQAERHKILAEH